MSNSSAFAAPKSAGQKLTADEVNALDAGQVAALTRGGTTPLTANATIQGASFRLTFDASDHATSNLLFKTGDSDSEFQASGAGRWLFPANRTRFSGAGNYPSLDTDTVTDVAPAAEGVFDPSEFTPNAQRRQQVQASKVLNYWLWLPVGVVVKQVKLYVKKAAGTGSLPGVLPSFDFLYYTMSSDAGTSVTTKADAPADIAAYRTYHAITSNTITHTIAAGRNYILSIVGDNDSVDAATGLYIYRPLVTVEVSSLRPF